MQTHQGHLDEHHGHGCNHKGDAPHSAHPVAASAGGAAPALKYSMTM